MATLNLSSVLEHSARLTPTRVAITFGAQQMTYADLDAQASRVAAGLHALGIRAGDHVALSCANVPWFPIVYFGILKAGAVVVPLNILLTEREIAYHLADSDARAYFCFEGGAGLATGKSGAAAFRSTPGCEHFVLIMADPQTSAPEPGVETLAE